MSVNILNYTQNTEEVFEHLIKEDNFEYNHVVIKSGFHFPAHPTDANVIITIVKGILSVKIEDQETKDFHVGQVLTVDRGVISVLGNNQEKPCELFVIKRR